MPSSAMTERRGSDGSLVLASPISLTGRYAHLGRLAAAGLHQAVEDVAHRGGVRVGGRTLTPEVVVFDDGGTRAGVRHALDVLAAPTSSSDRTAATSWPRPPGGRRSGPGCCGTMVAAPTMRNGCLAWCRCQPRRAATSSPSSRR